MIKSYLFTARSVALCPIQAWFSLRPYTREQRALKTTQKQQQRLAVIRERRSAIPIVLQGQFSDTSSPTDSSSVTGTANVEKVPSDLPLSESSQDQHATLLDHSALQRLYSLSDTDRLNAHCAGCGAQLHSHQPGAPGYLPGPEIEALKNVQIGEKPGNSFKQTLSNLCVRCQLTRQHAITFQESMSTEKYDELILTELLSQKKAAVLMVADMLNLPHCIVPLKLDQHESLRYILVGSKVDQLPIDGPKFYSRWQKALLDAFIERTGLNEEHVVHVSLVSSLTGYGMNRLLDFLLSSKFSEMQCPVYIVGSTNVGKSSLFNRLLLSDFCKSEARESIHRATVSYWPGTTIGLLKFPVARMSAIKHGQRDQNRYSRKHSVTLKEAAPRELHGYQLIPEQDPGTSCAPSNLSLRVETVREQHQDLSLMPTYRIRANARDGVASDQVFEETDVDLAKMFRNQLRMPVQLEPSSENGLRDTGERLLIAGSLDPRMYTPYAWCYDTPGLENPQQTLNYLSPKQLSEYLAWITGRRFSLYRPELRFILPRTFVVRPGLTMLVGRLGRLDVVSASGPVYLTTHTRLPVHIVETREVDSYLQDYAQYLGPGPSTEPSQTNVSIPAMSGVEISPIQPSDLDTSTADVILSGAGWVSVAGKQTIVDKESSSSESPAREKGLIHLMAWTPGGLGISLRKPPLLPYAIRRRGSRLLYLREYSGTNAEASSFADSK
ncbi:unnamed protein product [Schistocephalus solidus]|uniref:Nitric oxide-associated protein 1 n=1 Tax=Schistocephalus solidus TaxID=70667 RepID=A0A183T4P9_SCHSO|nr:unnamed protein product [Schistocephalus solidus]